jgi:aryl-alcohol dehydrogenase-like predicted oxidoreductase
MEYRYLGRSGLKISVLGLGTMTFGASGVFTPIGQTPLEEARKMVDRALEAGVNFIDTADIYSAGRSEEMIGEILKGRRDEVILATKARFPTGDGPNDAGSSRHHLMRSLEESLRRLQTDYVDLFQLHAWDGITPLEETLSTLSDMVHSGKVRYVGCSNYSAWHLMKSLAVADRNGFPRHVSHQIYYSLLAREVEYELVPAALDQGVGILVWAPLAGGLLTGKYRRGADGQLAGPQGARHLSGWHEPPIYDWDKAFAIIDTVVEIARQRGIPPAQVALAYLRDKPGIASLVVGARDQEQLSVNLGSAEVVLSEEERKRLDEVSAPPLLSPYWHQAANARDRLSPADLSLLGRAIPKDAS